MTGPPPLPSLLEWTGLLQVAVQVLGLVLGGRAYSAWLETRQSQRQAQELHVHAESFGRDDVVGETEDG